MGLSDGIMISRETVGRQFANEKDWSALRQRDVLMTNKNSGFFLACEEFGSRLDHLFPRLRFIFYFLSGD